MDKYISINKLEEKILLNKKIMVLAIFFVSLLAISAVSAADNATSDVVGVEKTTDEVVSVENDENGNILKKTNEENNTLKQANKT